MHGLVAGGWSLFDEVRPKPEASDCHHEPRSRNQLEIYAIKNEELIAEPNGPDRSESQGAYEAVCASHCSTMIAQSSRVKS
jgi:hypothetical protein